MNDICDGIFHSLTKSAEVLYHGTNLDLKKLKTMDLHGDPGIPKVVFSSPLREFALAYSGNKWGDRDIEQSIINNKMYLNEMRPGAIDDIFNTSGYLYELSPEDFVNPKHLEDRDKAWKGRARSERVAFKDVKPLNKIKIDNIKEELERIGVPLMKYDPTGKVTKSHIKRVAKRVLEMTPETREGYLKWREEVSPVEIHGQLLREIGKLQGIEKTSEDIRNKHLLVTGHSGAGKSTRAKELAKEKGLPLIQLDTDKNWERFMDRSKKPDFFLTKEEFYGLTRRMLNKALATEQPSIIEGAQILSHPSLAKKHNVLLVDTPEEQVRQQRIDREKRRAEKKGREWNEERTKNITQELLDEHRPKIERFKKIPGIELYTPPRL